MTVAAQDEQEPAEVTTPAPAPLTRHYPTKWSAPWILLFGLLGYELWAVATGKPGGPLSHIIWWVYGERFGVRWWLTAMPTNGFFIWMAAHFMLEWPELRELAWCVGVGLLVGVVGALVVLLVA